VARIRAVVVAEHPQSAATMFLVRTRAAQAAQVFRQALRVRLQRGQAAAVVVVVLRAAQVEVVAVVRAECSRWEHQERRTRAAAVVVVVVLHR
jgi:hypothetical protein